MGLDVKLHKKVRLFEGMPNDEDYENGNVFRAFTLNGFEDRIKNLEYGKYYISEVQYRTIGYSYSSHSWFRDNLCVIAGLPEKYWRHNHSQEDPFHELLYFADNEGCIDWEASESLYQDFLKFESKALTNTDNAFVNYYIAWMELFNRARINGNVIEFH
jgi:hypothetical protein